MEGALRSPKGEGGPPSLAARASEAPPGPPRQPPRDRSGQEDSPGEPNPTVVRPSGKLAGLSGVQQRAADQLRPAGRRADGQAASVHQAHVELVPVFQFGALGCATAASCRRPSLRRAGR